MSTVEGLEKERQARLRKVIANSPGDDWNELERTERALKQSIQSFSSGTLADGTLVIDSSTRLRRGRAAPSVRLDLTHRALAMAESIAEEEARSPPAPLPDGALTLSDKLTEISFLGNGLVSLPDELALCVRLRRLCAGANHLSFIPKLTKLPLEHVGLAGNQIDDDGLPSLLGNLPDCLRSLDISLNRLEVLTAEGGVLSALMNGCPSLKHLCLMGNPLAIRRSYPEDVLISDLGSRLVLLDDADVPPARDQVLQAAAQAEFVVEAEQAAVMKSDADSADPAANNGDLGGDAASEESICESRDRVTLRFTLNDLCGLPDGGSALQLGRAEEGNEAEGHDIRPSEQVQVRMSLMDQGRSSKPLEWTSAVSIRETFDVTVPRTVALRDALAVRGVSFEWILLPMALPDSESAHVEGSAPVGAAEVKEGAEMARHQKLPHVPADGLVLCTMTSRWRPLMQGQASYSQKLTASVQLPAVGAHREKRCHKRPPFELSMGVSCEILPE